MNLVLFNTLTRKKERFEPQDPDRVTMYVCGPTVYDYAHIGNMRGPVVFDILAKLLRRKYPKLVYARNVTDVDDKINLAAQERSVPIRSVADRYAAAYHEDVDALGVAAVDIEPYATEHIGPIIAMIQVLIEKGHAYGSDGHVLFSVSTYADYGHLSGRDPDEMLAGARIDVADYKHNPGDFVLWKPSSDELPGWDSPWGRGRPGWHIECSAMGCHHLGETIDIHGGGQDLVFPHHENEIAQATCANDGKPFARFWLHNGMINFGDDKMSKSLGNLVLAHDLRKQHRGEVLRFTLISAHYRKPLDWNEAVIAQSRRRLDRIYGTLRTLSDVPLESADIQPCDGVLAALHDDINTPGALAELAQQVKLANQAKEPAERRRLKGAIVASGALLGILQENPDQWLATSAASQVDAAAVEALIEKRNQARANRDFATADAIRDQLDKMGLIIEDGDQGTRWRIR